jgi:hypothetical protein
MVSQDLIEILRYIPVMLIDEGDKWREVAVEDLPIPPPKE